MSPLIGPLLALLTPAALAVESGEALRLELVGGVMVEGFFLRSDGDSLVLSANNGTLQVDAPLLVGVWRGEDPVPVDDFRAELEAWALATTTTVERTPSPVLVGAASVVWPGAGHAILGDWRGFAGYTAVECVLLGAAAYQIFYQESYGPLVPIAALDLLFRATATSEAVRTARRGRGSLVIAPSPQGVQVLWVSIGPTFPRLDAPAP